jgi:DNA-binding response OmpR family regulator
MNERRRILVVNGDRDMLGLLNRTLEVEGFETVSAGESGSAQDLLDSGPDLVILDTSIPGIEVFEIIDHLRQRSNVPIIILSQEYALETLSVALSRGADDFIRKPFGTKSFVARIRAKLRRADHQVV